MIVWSSYSLTWLKPRLKLEQQLPLAEKIQAEGLNVKETGSA
ncbi:MAG: hypothetical protein ACE5OW_02990 [Candidatus Bathyarchaeia archaeon]